MFVGDAKDLKINLLKKGKETHVIYFPLLDVAGKICMRITVCITSIALLSLETLKILTF